MYTTTIQDRLGRRTLTLPEKTALISQVTTLQTRLFDGEYHVRPEVTTGRATELLEQINVVRHELGWLAIDDHHQYLWPQNVPALSGS